MKRLFILLLFASPALAQQQTWVYRGPLLAGSITPALHWGIGFSLTFASPLQPGSTNESCARLAAVTPILPDGTYAPGIFFLSTDADGNISRWLIITAGSSGDIAMSSSDLGDVETFSYNDASIANVSSSTTGVWTLNGVTVVPAPPAPTIQDLEAQITNLTAQVSTLQTQRASYLKGYIDEYQTIMAYRTQIYALGAERTAYRNGYLATLARCRATGGKC